MYIQCKIGLSSIGQFGLTVSPCQTFYQYVHAYVLIHFSPVQLFATLRTVARQAPLSMGFSRQEYWSGLPCPPAGDLPIARIEPRSPVAPALQADSLLLNHQGRPKYHFNTIDF